METCQDFVISVLPSFSSSFSLQPRRYKRHFAVCESCHTSAGLLSARSVAQEPDVSGPDQPEKIMNCHYITAQLQLIRDANVGARDTLYSVDSTCLDEQLHAMESVTRAPT